MKKSRVLGIVLMVAALLMQVAYAATTQQMLNKIGDFDVQFSSISVETNYDDIEVDIQKKDGLTLQVDVGNFYPGASYKVDMGISNTGQLDAEIVGFDIQQTGTTTESTRRLYDMLKGYDTTGLEMSLSSYKDYLNQTYVGKQIKQNQSIDVLWNMGLSKELENLENEQLQYDMTIKFKQIQPETPITPPTEPPVPIEPTVPIEPEPTPAGPVIPIVEEPTPAGPTMPSEPENPQVNLPDEKVPAGRLPQTGGIPAAIVYVLGAGLFGTGAFLCRKKK